MGSYDDDLRFAHVLADAADDITVKRFKALDLRVETKPDLTPVSDADRATEDSIRNILRRSRPRDAVLGEESGQTGSGPRRWVIDPIDATKNYVRGVPVWATLIGLMDGDKVVAGVVTAPALGKRWWAAIGGGAWTGKSLSSATRCRVSGVSKISDASFSYSGIGGWEETGRLGGFLSLSRSVWRTRGFGDFWSHMLVAEGAVDISAEPDVSLWDLAALQVIVEEAGGRFTSLAGEATPDGGSVVCTNGRFHDEVLTLLADGGRDALPRGRVLPNCQAASSRSVRPACVRLVSPAARAQRHPARHIPRPPVRVPPLHPCSRVSSLALWATPPYDRWRSVPLRRAYWRCGPRCQVAFSAVGHTALDSRPRSLTTWHGDQTTLQRGAAPREAENRDVDVVAWLRAHRVSHGELVGLAVGADGSVSLAVPDGELAATAKQVLLADSEIRPRWVMWSQDTARRLVGDGVRVTTCWDIAAVQRLMSGRWRADPDYVWARLHGVPDDEIPGVASGEPDLFSVADEDASAQALGAAEALYAAKLQRAALAESGGGIAVTTARSESTVELLCAELAADGLPVDRAAAEALLAEIVGPRPRNAADAAAVRAARDSVVLGHAPAGVTADLRSPGQVRSLLAAAGIDVPDTRAHRLEEFRDSSPLVAALLDWRKAERIATTYGYGWLDEHLGPDGRLRGAWTGSDGAAGRMTASSGLHNMPAVLRRAVIAMPGHVFVRADLGQIEPRVLAAVSGDVALATATNATDMYLPVAAELGVDRPTAKVAMIAAMYGQTTGHGGTAGRGMRAAYPIAMGYLDTGDRSAKAGHDLRTYGGRLVRMSGGADRAATESSSARAARGRYGRNALIQGAAAELFKMWAVTVRARSAPLDARIVLCLHDELLVHVPAERAAQAADLVGDCLTEATRRWAPNGRVRFIAEISTVRCWADAKQPTKPPPETS